MFTNILIPTDGSDSSQHAVRTAVELAKVHQARVTGIHVIPDYHLLIAYEGAFDPVTEERIEQEAKARAEKYLEFVRSAAAQAGVACDTICETSDHPYDAIIKAADARRCDLIVMTSHGRTGLAAVLLGSETRKVLTHAKTPVLIVR
jgi:nucleotide-binding universal stress UspA family protein